MKEVPLILTCSDQFLAECGSVRAAVRAPDVPGVGREEAAGQPCPRLLWAQDR